MILKVGIKINKIVIIGANEFQNKLVMKANELGFETHVFAWEKGAVAKTISDYFYPISIVEKEDILKIVREINPNGICSIASDLAMPTVNYIANNLGLVGNSLECTENTTNKFEMRKLLDDKNLPCPKYQLIKDIEQIDFSYFNFPLIVKPIDRSGSRGVNKVESIKTLKTAIENSKKVSFNEEILIEEYIDGKEYSVEFITQNKKHHFLQVTEKFTTGSPNFIERGHLAPARLSNDTKGKIINIVRKSLDALGIKNGASHTEVKVTSNGKIKLIEVAGRMGGDFIGSDMVHISTGYDYVKNIINIAVGNDIDLIDIKDRNNVIVGFVFNEDDKDRFYKVKTLYPEIVIDENIKENFEIVQDSSSRNGYYIIKVQDKNNLIDVLNILDLEE